MRVIRMSDGSGNAINPEWCYPPSITAWEMRHKILRWEYMGMVYVTAPGWSDTNTSIDRERAEHRASRKAKEYADRAAQFYGGGTT